MFRKRIIFKHINGDLWLHKTLFGITTFSYPTDQTDIIVWLKGKKKVVWEFSQKNKLIQTNDVKVLLRPLNQEEVNKFMTHLERSVRPDCSKTYRLKESIC